MRTPPWQRRMRPTKAQVMAVLLFNLFLIGAAVALDPLPLTAFMIVLPSKNGVRKGAAFVFGWLVSMAIVVTATILATGNNPPKPSTAPTIASLAVKIGLGVFLVVTGVRRERRRGQPKEPKKTPKWQQQVDSMSMWVALGLGPTLQPWVLIGAGVTTVMEAKLSNPASALALFLYCVLASSTYLAMEIYAVAKPKESEAFLTRFRAWIDSHTDQVIIAGSLALGLWLIGSSITLLVG
jgi:hypothetical protein